MEQRDDIVMVMRWMRVMIVMVMVVVMVVEKRMMMMMLILPHVATIFDAVTTIIRCHAINMVAT